MVQRLAPAFGSGDSYVQVVLNLALPDEIIKTPWPQAGIKWYVLSAGFTRYNASYFNLPPFKKPMSYYTISLPKPELVDNKNRAVLV